MTKPTTGSTASTCIAAGLAAGLFLIMAGQGVKRERIRRAEEAAKPKEKTSPEFEKIKTGFDSRTDLSNHKPRPQPGDVIHHEPDPTYNFENIRLAHGMGR